MAVHADSLSWVEVQKVAALGGQPVSAWRGDGMKGETSLTDRMTQLESPLLVLAPEAKQDAALGVRFDSSDPIMMVPLVGEGEGDHSLQLGRIDVVHVVVTNSDDSETTVEGGYAVLEAQSGTKLLPRGAAWIPTGFGVDVFPGDYIVRASYEHPADGARMTEDYPVSFSQ